MAPIFGGIERAKVKYANINTSALKLVGWGAGQFFEDYYPFIKEKINVEYAVCPRPENQGRTIHNIKVLSPDNLFAEDENTLVVVFSAHYPMILSTIRDSYPQLKAMLAFEFGDEYPHRNIETFFKVFREQIAPPPKKLSFEARTGIFVQGKIEESTPQVLAWNKYHNPSIPVVFATWSTQDKSLIEACEPWVDELLLIKPPENTGHQYFNSILRGCRAGLQYLEANNVQLSVRCRSDMLIIGSVEETADVCFGQVENHEKIAISLSHTLRHIPFFFGEKLMMGSTKNLLDLWSMSESKDPPTDWREVFPPPDRNRHFLAYRNSAVECDLWTKYAEARNYATNSLVESNKFARENLMPLDPHLNFCSIKWLPLINGNIQNGLDYNLEIWRELIETPLSYDRRSEAIEKSSINLGEFLGKKIWS